MTTLICFKENVRIKAAIEIEKLREAAGTFERLFLFSKENRPIKQRAYVKYPRLLLMANKILQEGAIRTLIQTRECSANTFRATENVNCKPYKSKVDYTRNIDIKISMVYTAVDSR